jgi:gluconokinase
MARRAAADRFTIPSRSRKIRTMRNLRMILGLAALVAGLGGGLACSALARRYRDRLGLPHPRIRLVQLDDPSGVIRQRMEQRAGHFMPTALLESQLALLERPTADERPIVVDVASEPDAIVRSIVASLD